MRVPLRPLLTLAAKPLLKSPRRRFRESPAATTARETEVSFPRQCPRLSVRYVREYSPPARTRLACHCRGWIGIASTSRNLPHQKRRYSPGYGTSRIRFCPSMARGKSGYQPALLGVFWKQEYGGGNRPSQ